MKLLAAIIIFIGMLFSYMIGFNSGYTADRKFMEKHEAEALERIVKSCENQRQ